MENEAQYPLDVIYAVQFSDGRIRYIKEKLTKEAVEGKESVEVTLVYVILPPRMNLYAPLAYEDEKTTFEVKNIHSVQEIKLNE